MPQLPRLSAPATPSPQSAGIRLGVPSNQGQRDIAGAIGGLGEELGKIQLGILQKQGKIDRLQKQREYGEHMAQVQAELDPNEPQGWLESSKKASDSWLSGVSGMSPAVMKGITSDVAAYEGKIMREVTRDAQIAQVKNYAGEISNQMTVAEANGDWDLMRSINEQSAGDLKRTKQEVEATNLQIDAQQQGAVIDYKMRTNPAGLVKDLESGEFSLPQNERQRTIEIAEKEAKTQHKEQVYAESDAALEAVYGETLPSIEELDKMTPSLSKRERFTLHASLRKKMEFDAEGIRLSSEYQNQLSGDIGEALANYQIGNDEDFGENSIIVYDMISQVDNPARQKEFLRQFTAIRSGQKAKATNARDAAIELFDEKMKQSTIRVEPANKPGEQSLSSYLTQGLLENQENMVKFGISPEHAELIAEAAKGEREEITEGEEYEGASSQDLFRAYYAPDSPAVGDFSHRLRAAYESVRDKKGLTHMVVDPPVAARAEMAERERLVKENERIGKSRNEYYDWLDKNKDVTPEKAGEKLKEMGIIFKAGEIKDRIIGGRPERDISSIGGSSTARVAASYLGTREVAGTGNNPQISKWINKISPGTKTDSTAWCSAFVNAVAEESGLQTTNKLTARSWMDVGKEITPTQAKRGDVVVFWRESKSSWKGHVGFFHGYDAAGNVRVLGGNQGDAVSIRTYPAKRLLGVRRLQAS